MYDTRPGSFADLRNPLLNDALLWLSIAAVPGVGLSLARALVIGWRPLMLLHLVLLAALWLIWLYRNRASYNVRVSGLLAVTWLATFGGFVQFGPIAVGGLFAILFAFIAILFLEVRVALWLIVGNTLCLALVGFAASQHWLAFDLNYQVYAYHPLTWLHAVWNLSAFAAVIALIGRRMVRGLQERETAVRKLVEHQQMIAANIPGIIYQFLLRRDGHASFPYFSESTFHLIGIEPEKLMQDATAAFALVHPDDIGQVKATIASSAENLTPILETFRVMLPQREVRWVERISTPERLPNGDTLWHGFMMDITQRKTVEEALQQNEQRFRGLFELSSVGIALNDYVTGQFLAANDALLAATGYPRDELLTLSNREITPKDFAGQDRKCLEEMESTGRYGPCEKEYRSKDGGHIPVLLHGFKMIDSTGRPVVWSIVQDISERRRAEQEIREAKDAAESASRAKSAFLASMSHELRTPLNAIIGFAQMLDMDRQTPLDTEQKEAVDHILHGGRHLLDLINEMLDLARIEAGKMELSIGPVELGPVIADTAALINPAAARRRIVIRHSCPPNAFVLADERRVRQIMLNLLSNAVKYNNEGGLVTVSCQIRDAMVRITVIDTGPGIPKERYPQLFELYQRLGAERTAVEGTGIGLVICRKLAEAMGGVIGFDSEVGVGSRFWLNLPLASTTTLADAAMAIENDILPRPPPDETLPSSRVLYVEDNVFNQAVMRQIFRQLPGVELRLEDSAEAGLEVVRTQQPALVLMDINLPGMNGLDALKILKGDPHTAAIPIIAITAAALPDDVQAGLEAGFTSYLTKPFDVAVLLALVRSLIEQGPATPDDQDQRP
ncbi:MAG: PAS domain S-box protein [Parasulfuritortus sp.]|nr:PAS domain S-box protein [Parasulfuritortus sp.]